MPTQAAQDQAKQRCTATAADAGYENRGPGFADSGQEDLVFKGMHIHVTYVCIYIYIHIYAHIDM